MFFFIFFGFLLQLKHRDLNITHFGFCFFFVFIEGNAATCKSERCVLCATLGRCPKVAVVRMYKLEHSLGIHNYNIDTLTNAPWSLASRIGDECRRDRTLALLDPWLLKWGMNVVEAGHLRSLLPSPPCACWNTFVCICISLCVYWSTCVCNCSHKFCQRQRQVPTIHLRHSRSVLEIFMVYIIYEIQDIWI